MTLAITLSAALLGIEAHPIHIEVHFSRGLPGWSTVGLAENAVKESKDRVLSALNYCGYDVPLKKITLNLAPADIKKSGTAFDLPIAMGLLTASNTLAAEGMEDYLMLGELSLTGRLRPVRGTLSIACLAKDLGLKGLILPKENAVEAQAVSGLPILAAQDLPEVVEFFVQGKPLSPPEKRPALLATTKNKVDFSEVQGQHYAKRALEIAAAGFHNLLMVGPPGTGKSMLAHRLPTILPKMSFAEQITTTKIYSYLGLLPKDCGLLDERPFRAPHHSISDAGLIGGGKLPRPGEVSLSHHGVLFLDEFTEFKTHVLESLRQPLENHQVTISRSLHSLTYPARFLLVAAMNPCPCGQYGNPLVACRCSEPTVQKYQAKVSGPLLDRIDLQVPLSPLKVEELIQQPREESSQAIQERVETAMQRQRERFRGGPFQFNSDIGPREVREFCRLDSESEELMALAIRKWGISARVYHRILKVARTIADLEGKGEISTRHLSEAIGYRLNVQEKKNF